MPIYAYRCGECGHAKDVLQKLSDAPLTTCPSCGKDAFKKQLTAAGFQLKGTGWYVTDFRNNGASAPAAGDKGNGKPADGAGSAQSAAKSTEKAADAAAAPSAAPTT
jgi:putative FmdB family regulatory protein